MDAAGGPHASGGRRPAMTLARTTPRRGAERSPAASESLGWAFSSSADAAHELVGGTSRGRFGLRDDETLDWFGALWLPGHLIELSLSAASARPLRRSPAADRRVNLYDAVEGHFLRAVRDLPWPVDLTSAPTVEPLRRGSQIETRLRRAVEARKHVTSPGAISRHEVHLAALGLPVPIHEVTVTATTFVHLPLHVGVLSGREERVVAVDGVTGRVDERVTTILTRRLTHLRGSLR